DCGIEDLVCSLHSAGVRHITSSTYKARPDSIKKITAAFPEEGAALKELFSRGGRNSGSSYLPVDLRRSILENVASHAHQAGITFSTCREGFVFEEGISCDGSHLLPL
ncbi:MAG: radical SAM protein, partial [Methanothrix soehngenii]|nr:radical SAM protein [Methanothrix soehngenii]